MDSGDNSGDLRSTLFAANTIFDLAGERNINHFFIMCDDYYDFYYAFPDTKGKVVSKNLDRLFKLMVDFYESTTAKSIAFAIASADSLSIELALADARIDSSQLQSLASLTTRP